MQLPFSPLARVLKSAAYACAALALAAPAWAHTSYLKPNVFSTASRGAVTIEASFTEDFFQPEFPVDAQDYHLFRPDGTRDAFDNIAALRQMTVLESDLTEPGTYRFTTGERLGRRSTQVFTDGAWRPLEPGQTAPRRARTRESQTVTVAEVYVTKGAPTDIVLGLDGGRLAIRPITHPSAIYLNDGFRFQVLFDGAPLAAQEVNLYRDGGAYDETPFHQTVQTDATGAVALRFDRPGIYLIMVRHSGDAPPSAETAVRSYTTALTFEVSR